MDRYTPEAAEAAIESGDADLIAFGRLYLSTPDLPERVANAWPLAAPLDYKYYYTPSPEYASGAGYIHPKYQASA